MCDLLIRQKLGFIFASQPFTKNVFGLFFCKFQSKKLKKIFIRVIKLKDIIKNAFNAKIKNCNRIRIKKNTIFCVDLFLRIASKLAKINPRNNPNKVL